MSNTSAQPHLSDIAPGSLEQCLVFHGQIREFLFSPEEVAAHLQEADDRIQEKAKRVSVL